jgi:hypothetical protein
VPSRATSTLFSLLCWVTRTFQVAADAILDLPSTEQWILIVESWASLLDTLYDRSDATKFNGTKVSTLGAAERLSRTTINHLRLAVGALLPFSFFD